MAKQLQVHDRIFVGELPDQEHRDTDRRNDAGDDNKGRIEPVLIVALIEHHLQGPYADDQGDQADVVDFWPLGFLDPAFHLVGDHHAGEDADGDLDEEDPGPRNSCR